MCFCCRNMSRLFTMDIIYPTLEIIFYLRFFFDPARFLLQPSLPAQDEPHNVSNEQWVSTLKPQTNLLNVRDIGCVYANNIVIRLFSSWRAAKDNGLRGGERVTCGTNLGGILNTKETVNLRPYVSMCHNSSEVTKVAREKIIRK